MEDARQQTSTVASSCANHGVKMATTDSTRIVGDLEVWKIRNRTIAWITIRTVVQTATVDSAYLEEILHRARTALKFLNYPRTLNQLT